MKLEEIRHGVFQATFSARELSVLIAGARMSLDLMENDPSGSTAEARDSLAGVLADLDAHVQRIREARGPAE